MTTDLTPNEIASVDAAYWANLFKIRLQRCQWTLKNHEYQLEPMQNTCKRVCYMKATRGGFSEIEILKSLHGMIHSRYGEGVLYLFPTTDDVHEFSKSRFDPLLLANREAIGKYVKPGGKGTDTTSLKKIHRAFLYLRGARLSEKRGDQSESSKMKSIGVDKVVFDEIDHMDDEVIAKARGRYYDSPYQEEVFIGNPIIPELGIDKQWALSDQRHWFRRCGCGEWTCAELSFPDCVKIRDDGTGYIGCNKCSKQVLIYAGAGTAEWVPSIPDNTDYMKGYRWSQLTSAVCDPADILADFSNPPEGNLADVYRLRLGLPYIAAEDRLAEAQVFECCNMMVQSYSHTGPCAMGVDVGKTKHVVIGTKTGRDQYTVVKVAQLSKWEDIHDLAKRFNVKSAVVDIRPYEDSARKFQSEAGFKTFLCEYKENVPYGTQYNDKTGIVSVNRTEIFDSTHRMVVTPGMLTIPRFCPEIKEFARQVCGAYKVLETNKKSGTAIYRYKGKNEHYRNALNYFLLAARRSAVARVAGSRNRQKVANNTYERF
ncbi:hypothetical protein CL634_06830 [bacterium]|nr:hypothetical protein [bacterium]